MSNKNPTIYDVAELACVSLATASRVMNGIDKVAPDTKQRVLDAIKQLNYKPSSVAVELASRRNTTVSIVVPELKYTYIAHVVSGLMEEANKLGYDCVISTTSGTKKDFSKVINKVISQRPNGIVIFNDSLTEEEFNEFLQFDIPLVTLGIDLKTVSSVTWHYRDQVTNLVNEAMSRNKDIYFIKLKDGGMVEKRILTGIKNAYIQNGKEFGNIIEVDDSYESTYSTLSNMLSNIHNALFIATRDSIALAGLNAALDLNIKVPEYCEFLAVIGTKYSELSRPKLSSFDIDMKGLGKEGMKVLAEVITNNDELITKKLPFKFVKRGSTL